MSKTKDAIALVEQGMAPYAAAKQVGLTPNSLYVALKKRREQHAAGLVHCPCCDSLVPAERIKKP